MPRKKKQEIKVNNVESLEGLVQETYDDACLQIVDAQSCINDLKSSTLTNTNDVDDLTKIAKAKTDYLKIKDSGIKIKLEIAKLQSDILKNKGDTESAIQQRSEGKATLEDFRSIKEMLKGNTGNNSDAE